MNCIFGSMSIRLKIFSTAFIGIFAFLQVLPIIKVCSKEVKPVAVTKKSTCPKMKKPACTMNTCSLPPKDSKENDDCGADGCNPFVPCSMGFCCYLVESIYTFPSSDILLKQNLTHFDDDRISSSLSECWHPPELIS
jgi:hypothetical protein